VLSSKNRVRAERQFLRQSGEFVGACKHIGADDQETLKIELISEEAVKTSEIEGEILNRDSVQSSLRAQLDPRRRGTERKAGGAWHFQDDARSLSQLRRSADR
jgi:Fic family protein